LIATLTDVHALRSTIIVIYVVRYLLVALIHSLPVEWKFVAKKELLWIPFFGWALGCADPVIIDRSNREKSVKSLQRAAERGLIRVHYGKPIATAGLSPEDRNRLKEQVREAILAGFDPELQGLPVPSAVDASGSFQGRSVRPA
jgi:1-acyl-sn-glycerol-3-phosphate acyltransferase